VKLLDGIEVRQTAVDEAPEVARKAVDFAGQIARLLGAEVSVDHHYSTTDRFLSRGKSVSKQPLEQWAAPGRFLLSAGIDTKTPTDGVSAVVLKAAPGASEATLFADSGLSDLLGDPERQPLVPEGDYGAGTVGLGLITALCALVVKWRRYRQPDVALVGATSVLSWVNWKAALAGDLGQDLQREGDQAEWPVIECADGHFALVYTERDWPSLVKMIADPLLEDAKFSSFRKRSANRNDYLAVVRQWAKNLTKAELSTLFETYQIPAAPVMTAVDLLRDPLLLHRQAFSETRLPDGVACRSPVLPHRVTAVSGSERSPVVETEQERLPLEGFRVLDLGIITAGAGVGALLADLGAEVLKIESETYPDPFRAWAGDAVSPFFKGNNRNKKGVALDLKTDSGKASFIELVKTADVVIENFRRGVLDRLGFDYARLKAINPDILLASISGQGLTGPGSTNSSFGSTLEASSGFAANIHYGDQRPYITGRNVNFPDQTVVLYAAAVITAALSQSKCGMHLDVSQRDVALFLSGDELEQVSAGRLVERSARVDIDRAATGSEMLAMEMAHNSSAFMRSPDGDLVKGMPFQLSRSPLEIRTDSPAIGEHTAEFI